MKTATRRGALMLVGSLTGVASAKAAALAPPITDPLEALWEQYQVKAVQARAAADLAGAAERELRALRDKVHETKATTPRGAFIKLQVAHDRWSYFYDHDDDGCGKYAFEPDPGHILGIIDDLRAMAQRTA